LARREVQLSSGRPLPKAGSGRWPVLRTGPGVEDLPAARRSAHPQVIRQAAGLIGVVAGNQRRVTAWPCTDADSDTGALGRRWGWEIVAIHFQGVRQGGILTGVNGIESPSGIEVAQADRAVANAGPRTVPHS